MPLKIELEADGRDRGTLVVRGLPELGSEVLVAVQRLTDDRYLTVHRLWDSAPGWHPCARLGADDGAARFDAGQALTAGIRGAAGTPLRVHLRRGDYADAGSLEIRAPDAPRTGAAEPFPETRVPAAALPEIDLPATGSGQARASLPQTPPAEPLRPLADSVPDALPALPVAWATDTTEGSGSRGPRAQSSRFWGRRRLALLVLSVLCILGLIWRFMSVQDKGPTVVSRPPTRAATGKDLYLELKRQNLTAADLFGQAERADQAGDCEAAVRLFLDAAKRDAGLAERLGRRYDPEDFRPTPCFPEPRPDSALVWYQGAAEHGIPQAQRRYAELLLGETTTGPVYQDAVNWLRKAAAAGDAAAARRLATLGER